MDEARDAVFEKHITELEEECGRIGKLDKEVRKRSWDASWQASAKAEREECTKGVIDAYDDLMAKCESMGGGDDLEDSEAEMDRVLMEIGKLKDAIRARKESQ